MGKLLGFLIFNNSQLIENFVSEIIPFPKGAGDINRG